MTITIHHDLIQGSEEWAELRRGIITASEMKLLITPTLKVADNDKSRAHIFELAAQRISQYVEPSYISDDMLRGMTDEETAASLYNEHWAPVERVGFITNDKFGFTIGYSPDGLIGDDGAIEIKGRRQRFLIETIISGEMPADYMLQVQTGLMVSERKWVDFITFSGGLPMKPIRVHANAAVQEVIATVASAAEYKIREKVAAYEDALKAGKWVATERKIEQEMYI